MKTIVYIAVLMLTSFLCIAPAGAVTLRYALIMGNNVGVDINGNQPFPPLMHSEREALKLKQRLVRFANFDATTRRTKVLIGATKRDFERVIEELVAQKKRDTKTLGAHKTLFFFYFTGHGLQKELLLDDGPLQSSEIGELFRVMEADFSIGIFDACYSGSLQDTAFETKGLTPIPGLDLFRELPEEVISAEGSVWYVSSGPGQVSYEDTNLGGVFTHFFTEALERAEREGPGITLDRIWDYTREKTVEFTTSKRYPQVPERFISKLRSSTPLYFSFPLERTATLVLSESMEGRFILSYANGHLTEAFHKAKDKEMRLAVYPGTARLMLIKSGTHRVINNLSLSEGSTIVLHQFPEEAPVNDIGERTVDLWEKGLGTDRMLTASTVARGVSALLGVGYGFTYTPEDALLPLHTVYLSSRLDYAHLVFDMLLGYGYDTNTYDNWGYTAHALTVGMSGGYGFDLKSIRLEIGVDVAVANIWQVFADSQKRHRVSLVSALALGVLFPTFSSVLFELSAWGGPTRCPEVGIEKTMVWRFSAGAMLSLFYRFR